MNIDYLLKDWRQHYEEMIDNEPVKYEPLFDAEDVFFTMDKTFLYGPKRDDLETTFG